MVKYEKQNALFNRKETYDQNGNQQGYEKKNDLYNRTDKYNSNGNQTGYKNGTTYISDMMFMMQMATKWGITNTMTYTKNGNILKALTN